MENEYPKGLFAKKPHANAPQFIKAKLSVKREEFITYLQSKDDEWLNFDVTENQEGDRYGVKLDTWKPQSQGQAPQNNVIKATELSQHTSGSIDDPADFDGIDPSDIPF